MTTLTSDEEIELILRLYGREIERKYGGRTVGRTLVGEEAKTRLQALITQAENRARIDEEILTLTWVLSQLTFTDADTDVAYIERRLKELKSKEGK